MIKIESNIPLPSNYAALKKYPWGDMKVGDSFFVSNVKQKTLSSNASLTGKKLQMKFTIRTVEGGCRVWRVA